MNITAEFLKQFISSCPRPGRILRQDLLFLQLTHGSWYRDINLVLKWKHISPPPQSPPKERYWDLLWWGLWALFCFVKQVEREGLSKRLFHRTWRISLLFGCPNCLFQPVRGCWVSAVAVTSLGVSAHWDIDCLVWELRCFPETKLTWIPAPPPDLAGQGGVIQPAGCGESHLSGGKDNLSYIATSQVGIFKWKLRSV